MEESNNSNVEMWFVEQETAKYFVSMTDLLQVVSNLRFRTSNPTSVSTVTNGDTHTDDTLFHRPQHPHPHQPQQPPSQQLPNEIGRRIVQFLLVQRIQRQHVTAIACSSLYSDSMIQRNSNTNSNTLHPLALLAHCLTDDESTWWISQDGVNVRPQYVDFCCVPSIQGHTTTVTSDANLHISAAITNTSVVRIQSVSIKIPTLPFGPMSLREFVIQRSKCQSQSHPNHDTNHSTSTDALDNDDDDDDDDEMNHHSNTDIDTAAVEWETISPTWTLHAYTTGYQTFTFPAPGVDVTHVRLLCLSNQISAEEQDPHWIPLEIPQSVGFYSIRFD
jgi:hypothetical protein